MNKKIGLALFAALVTLIMLVVALVFLRSRVESKPLTAERLYQQTVSAKEWGRTA